MTPPQPSELTIAADALAHVVAQLIPEKADPQLAHQFRLARGKLLESTHSALSGATVMAAGAVVALDNKLNRLAASRGERLQEIQRDVDRLSARLHTLEDEFLDDGQIGQMVSALYGLAGEFESLKQRQAGG
jgi:hypothetical protein